MIAEARRVDKASPWYVSAFWSDALTYLNYIRELSDKQLAFIRIHTSLITGHFTLQHIHDPRRLTWDDEQTREGVPLVAAYKALVEDVPESHWCDEPALHQTIENIGFRWRGKLLTDDLLRYQRALTNLYNLGLVAPKPRRLLIFEIGGGYGALAHQVHRVVAAPGVAYIIVDLPEMLFWSAVYLRVNNPGKRLYVFDRQTFSPAQLPDILANHDFVLLPPYLLAELPTFPDIDLAINMLSFQEMREDQIRVYCDFLARHLNGWFLSENFARHKFNTELGRDLYDI